VGRERATAALSGRLVRDAHAILQAIANAENLIRPPLQRRSRESLERLLQTGLELLQEKGFDGFTLQELSQRAGVSIGSIYGRVEGREALIMAIYERAMESIDEEEHAKLERVQSLPGLSPRERVERVITTAAETMLANGDVLGVFMRQAPRNSEILTRAAEISSANARIFARALLAHREDMRHPDPELAVDVAWRMIYCTIARRITHGPRFESTRPLSDQRLVRELTRATLDYLF
jgi:AcrR family transcriptional regulator